VLYFVDTEDGHSTWREPDGKIMFDLAPPAEAPIKRVRARRGSAAKKGRGKTAAISQACREAGLNKDYGGAISDHLLRLRYSRTPDGGFLDNQECVMCRERTPISSVFFPCDHRCVCDRTFCKHPAA
jgi:hypothetical protein